MTTPATISGLVLPFNTPGDTSAGRLYFDSQSLTWSQPNRVKLLISHDQGAAIGYAVALEVTDEGLRGTFVIDPETPGGADAIRSAQKQVRDGFSIGAQLADEVRQALATGKQPKNGTRAAGVLREVSLCAIPVYDDARVDDVTVDASQLPAAAAVGPTPTGGTTMPGITTAAGPTLATAAAPTGLVIAAGALAAQASTEPPAPAEATVTEPPAATPPAAAGSFQTRVTDSAVYSLDGRGPSFVRDAFAAQSGDLEAMSRLHRFNAAMQDDTSAQLGAIAAFAARVLPNGRLAEAAVVSRGPANDDLYPEDFRPGMMLRAIDAGRPLTSRVRNLPLAGPNPFRLPVFGEFDGVADHVEGTNHVAEGTVEDVGSQVITPTAVSGAWRCSRELAESTGASIDQLVVQEMVADYRRNTEARLVATLELAKPVADVGGIDLPEDLLAQLLAFFAARKASPTVAAMGLSAYTLMATVKAADGRPYFPFLGASNAAGTSAAGLTALNIQGVDGVYAWSADPSDTWLINGQDVATFESAPRLFRFEEVEGPGIIKFAIWGYQAAHVFRSVGVRRLARA